MCEVSSQLLELFNQRKPAPAFLPGDVTPGGYAIKRVVWDRGAWLYLAEARPAGDA